MPTFRAGAGPERGWTCPSSRTGSRAFLYGVGCVGNFTRFQSADPIGGTPTHASPSLGAKIGAGRRDRQDPLFASYQGTTTDPAGGTTAPVCVAGTGGGSDVLQSASPAKATVRSAVPSHGLTGAARPATADAAGIYV